MAVCGPIDLETRVVEAPSLVVEVASPSTRRIDRGEKLLAYHGIDALRLHLIVEQDQRLVERHWREASGAWPHESVTDGSGGRVPVSAPSTVLTLRSAVITQRHREHRAMAVEEHGLCVLCVSG